MKLQNRTKYRDGRRDNRPPVRKPSLDDATVAIIDQMVEFGVMQKNIALKLSAHPRTVMAAVNRTGAYARIPKRVPLEGEAKQSQTLLPTVN